MHDLVMLLNEFGHVVIAGAYAVLGLLCFYISLPEPWRERAAHLGGASFFWGCGLHHVEMLDHIISGNALDGTAVHHVLPTLMQVVGAPTFIFAVGPYIPDLIAALRRRRGRGRGS